MRKVKAPANPVERPLQEEVPWEAEIAEDGVDLGQIRSMLALTPTQRLERMQDFLDGIMALRSGRKMG